MVSPASSPSPRSRRRAWGQAEDPSVSSWSHPRCHPEAAAEGSPGSYFVRSRSCCAVSVDSQPLGRAAYRAEIPRQSYPSGGASLRPRMTRIFAPHHPQEAPIPRLLRMGTPICRLPPFSFVLAGHRLLRLNLPNDDIIVGHCCHNRAQDRANPVNKVVAPNAGRAGQGEGRAKRPGGVHAGAR